MCKRPIIARTYFRKSVQLVCTTRNTYDSDSAHEIINILLLQPQQLAAVTDGPEHERVLRLHVAGVRLEVGHGELPGQHVSLLLEQALAQRRHEVHLLAAVRGGARARARPRLTRR